MKYNSYLSIKLTIYKNDFNDSFLAPIYDVITTKCICS